MKRKYKGDDQRLDFEITRVKDEGLATENRFEFTVPGGGTIQVVGNAEFVSTILRQLLEHPDSPVTAALVEGYHQLPPKEQKRFRRDFKIGEFADSDSVYWPMWLQ